MMSHNFNTIKLNFIQLLVIIIFIFQVNYSHAEDSEIFINEGLGGSWYNRDTSGQGVLIDVNSELEFIFLAWFTYNNEIDSQSSDIRNHRWFTASGNYSGNHAQLKLYETKGGRFDEGTPVVTQEVGIIEIEFNSCVNSKLTFTIEEEQLTGIIDLVRLTPDVLCQTFNNQIPSKTINAVSSKTILKTSNDGEINTGINGGWFEPATSGQGLLIDIIPEADAFFAGWFTYDENALNSQRWYTLNGSYSGSIATLEIYETSNGLFNQTTETIVTKVGDAQLQFSNCQQATLDYQFDSGVSGTVELKQLINSHLCDVLQIETVEIPNEVDNSSITAFYDVSVVSMKDEILLPHQTVLVENGIIIKADHFTRVLIPEEAIVLDGRNKYLGPGLTEMHMHIGSGGFINAKEAGLLLIANGVTTVLSMGDRLNVFVPEFGTMTVPKLGNLFESGEILGPNLIAGSVAFGGTIGDGDELTIATVTEAIAYASKIKNAGYEYLKEYWFLSPNVLNQFDSESVNLDLPIIGHIPRNRPMEESLSKGHKMAAHIQEPYVTFMNSQMDASLIEPTAQILLDNGTFVTPTLAVFESFVRVYGTNLEQYNALRSREGNQYISPLIKSYWQSYYSNPFNQSSTAVPGGFDPLYHFFEQMIVSYYQAGVPLLIGTDAPGFPGVMPGFGVIVEMELLTGLGLPTYEVYKAASKNAGQFVDETLNPEISFGTIEEGKRADLILLNSNPFESVDNLKRPLAVMARGRLWSQTFLQSQLDVLEEKYSNKQFDIINQKDLYLDSMYCVEHLFDLKIKD